jgi:hypothetical protein
LIQQRKKKPVRTLVAERRSKMPAQTMRDDLTALHAEHVRLTKIVDEVGSHLDRLDRVMKEISKVFMAAWSRRNQVERRIFLLEQKVKYCKPVSTASVKAPKTAAELMAKLTPAQIEMLKAILEAK